jgi:hypothetical protein
MSHEKYVLDMRYAVNEQKRLQVQLDQAQAEIAELKRQLAEKG